MTNIARTRRSRRMVGLSVSGVLLLISLLCLLVVAGVSAATDRDDYSATADAEILDVDRYFDDFVDELVVQVHLRFMTPGGGLTIAEVTWPAGRPLPGIGDTVEVAYDPADPEDSVELADVVRAETAESPPDLTGALVTSAVTGVLAVVGLGLTALWATRLPRPEMISPWRRYPGYGYPLHGAYPGYGAHPGPGHHSYPAHAGQPAPPADGSRDINPAALRRKDAPPPAAAVRRPPVVPEAAATPWTAPR